MTLTNIAIIGANGHLSKHILSALTSSTSPPFTTTVLIRSSSHATYPPSVTIHRIPSTPTHADLVHALRGQEALIMAFGHVSSTDQIALINAAAEAGVTRIIPADYGSVDSSSARACKLVPLYAEKAKVRKQLEDLAAVPANASAGFSWTSLVCGHFFDYGLESGLLQFFPQQRRAGVFDGGEVKASVSTLAQVARGVVGVLREPERSRNRMLYMQSFCVTQNQVLAVLETVAGGEWTREELDSEEFTERWRRVLEERPGDAVAIEELVSVLGVVDADWTGCEGFAMEMLGLVEEDLEAVVRGVVERLGM